MRIDNVDQRHFYEIEAARNHWGLKELQRQFDSALYERLALSRDKDNELYLPDKKELQEKLREWIAEETGGEEL